MARTGSDNPRGGTVGVHTKARMWDRLMVEAAQHGGLRALTYGDGTLIVYDPVLTAEEADTALPEWLTGHPAVTSYPLKPQLAHPRTIADTRNTVVHRHPGARNHERGEYDPITLEPVRNRARSCEICADNGADTTEGVGRVALMVRGQEVIAWLCPRHRKEAIAAQDKHEAEYVRRLALTPEQRAAEDVEALHKTGQTTPFTATFTPPDTSTPTVALQCGWDSACKEPAAPYQMDTDTHSGSVPLCENHARMARTFLGAIGGSLRDRLPE